MRRRLVKILLAVLVALSQAQALSAQSGRGRGGAGTGKVNTDAGRKTPEAAPTPTPTPEPTPADVPEAEDGGDEPVRVETNLVTVPVIASDRGGRYVPDLKAEEFTVSEDGAEQKLAFFATVTAPFHLVLMLDTSASASIEKLGQVKDAAVAFVNELHPEDRVKVISFDDQVRDHGDFTGDRTRIAGAIGAAVPGKGTRLYDAFDMALRALGRVKGRKAIVLLTDGVDFHSERRTYEHNRRAVEEGDIIVYPVRFDTREETERLAREQARGGGQVDLGTILGGRLPGSVVINPRGRAPRETRREDGLPDVTSRGPGNGTGGPGDTRDTRGPSDRRPEPDDNIGPWLDQLYRLADDYLNEMANLSGGRLVRADTPGLLPQAFRQIAEELRTQYSLGYYPTNTTRGGKFRKIRVRTTRKNVSVRARPGYRK